MFRRVLIAAVTAGLLMTLAGAPRVLRAQVPNRIYGAVTLNGAAAAPGTSVVALTSGKTCGSATVTAPQVSGITYQLDVPAGGSPQECKPGAVITFTVAGLTAAQSFTLDDIGTFRRIDLTAPGTPNLPSRTVNLPAGCTEVTSTWPDGTTAAAVAATVTPAEALSAIWRWDAQATNYRGYSAASAAASDLATINRNEVLRVCVTATATLTQPTP